MRLAALEDGAPPVLIGNHEHRFLIAEQMQQIGVAPGALLLEPMGRNTAPAVAVAALVAEMVREDLKLAERDDLARRHGHRVFEGRE